MLETSVSGKFSTCLQLVHLCCNLHQYSVLSCNISFFSFVQMFIIFIFMIGFQIFIIFIFIIGFQKYILNKELRFGSLAYYFPCITATVLNWGRKSKGFIQCYLVVGLLPPPPPSPPTVFILLFHY